MVSLHPDPLLLLHHFLGLYCRGLSLLSKEGKNTSANPRELKVSMVSFPGSLAAMAPAAMAPVTPGCPKTLPAGTLNSFTTVLPRTNISRRRVWVAKLPSIKISRDEGLESVLLSPTASMGSSLPFCVSILEKQAEGLVTGV